MPSSFLRIVVSAFLFCGVQRPPDVPRIQLGSYTNPKLKIFNDPLTEIVKVGTAAGWGTGTFLPECRVMTALHVLLSLKHSRRTERLEKGESLVGQPFGFETQPIQETGRSVTGQMIVLGHGALKGTNNESDSLDDWAIGYDPGCLSEELKLGFVRLMPGQTLSLMQRGEFFTAGHSQLDAAKKDGRYHLYIDSSCGVVADAKVNPDRNANFIITNCSVSSGGSGQLLLNLRIIKGEARIGLNGRVEKIAYGIFQREVPGFDLAQMPGFGLQIPNVNLPSGISIFSNEFYLGHLGPFLTGPVDTPPPPFAAPPRALCDLLAQLGEEAQGGFKIRRAVKPSQVVSFPGLATPDRCEFPELLHASCAWRSTERVSFDTLSKGVRGCFPSAETRILAKEVSVTIPVGVRGGPSRFNIRLDGSVTLYFYSTNR